MEASTNKLPPPALPAASPVQTVTVAVRLFHKQRANFYLLAGFVGSGLLAVALPWVAGQAKYVFWLAGVLFFLLPFAIVFVCRASYIKPALLSFTPQGLCLEASDKHYQAAWADLVAYKVEFTLGKLVGDGYRLSLRDTQGHSVALNLLEHQLVNSTDGLRSDSALAYLCRYIGWHNRQVEGDAEKIVLLPGLLSRKIGVMLGGLGALLLVDFGIRWLHPAKTGSTVGLLAVMLVLMLQLLGQKKSDDRYAHYLRNLQEPQL